MKLRIDTREQKPYSEYFDKMNIPYTVETLPIGDYAIEGVKGFALERKELNDFIISVTRERKRFERMLEKAKKLNYFAVLLECTIYDILNRNYYSRMHPGNLLGTIFSWSIKHNIPFLFCECRTGGAVAVVRLSRAYLKYRGGKSE